MQNRKKELRFIPKVKLVSNVSDVVCVMGKVAEGKKEVEGFILAEQGKKGFLLGKAL
jgi:hypothetical protein